MRGYITDSTASGGLRLATDLPEPTARGSEVLVEVRAFGVNRGELSLLQERADDWRPGQDLSGVVIAGAADGSGLAVGTRVVGVVDAAAWSERVAVPTAWAAAIPDAVSFEQAASLPVAGLTAYRALLNGGSVLGRNVLVLGATGGVGQFAVQLAVASGARVTAQVSGPERYDEVRRLGASEVTVDLSGDGLGPFQLICAGVVGETLAAAVRQLAPGGMAIVYGAVGGEAKLGPAELLGAPNARIMGIIGSQPEDERGVDLGVLAGFIADGRLAPVLGEVRDWREMQAVLDGLRQRGIRGKAVLTIPVS